MICSVLGLGYIGLPIASIIASKGIKTFGIDVNKHLVNDNFNLPVGVIECMEAGIVAMKLDESIKTNSIIDLTSIWNELDKILK